MTHATTIAGPSRATQTVRRGAFVWKLRDPDLDGDWLQHPERLFDEMPSVRKRPPSPVQTRVVRFQWKTRNLVLKEYHRRRLRTIGRAIVRGAAALHALEVALELEKLGIPALRVVAAGYRRAQPWYSVLVTEEISGAVPLHACLKQPQRNIRRLARSAARLFAKLHDVGLIHRDAHEANFLVPERGSSEIIIIDLDGVRASRRVTLRQVAKDLNRLHVRLRDRISTAARLRFLVDYSRFRRVPVSSRDLAKAFAALGARLR